MGARRRQRSAATRRRLAERWLASGVTQRRFAEEHGVPPSSLARWVQQLRRSDAAAAPPAGFLEVTQVTAPAPAMSVRLTVGSVTLELERLPPVEYVVALGAATC
ncbi:MAG: hypothetical protein Kow0067_19550 [Coriobacteriia bacterium]